MLRRHNNFLVCVSGCKTGAPDDGFHPHFPPPLTNKHQGIRLYPSLPVRETWKHMAEQGQGE